MKETDSEINHSSNVAMRSLSFEKFRYWWRLYRNVWRMVNFWISLLLIYELKKNGSCIMLMKEIFNNGCQQKNGNLGNWGVGVSQTLIAVIMNQFSANARLVQHSFSAAIPFCIDYLLLIRKLKVGKCMISTRLKQFCCLLEVLFSKFVFLRLASFDVPEARNK